MNERRNKLLLASVSGLLLGVAFPPVPVGITAIFGFVPFFFLFESIDLYGRAFRYSYLTFFVFNLIGVYWVGGFTHFKDIYLMISGVLLFLAHPFFFYLPVAAWIFIRRNFGFKFSIFAFPFLWVGFEYLHASTEIGFPWLMLGNTQTYNLSLIQFASFTGVYGVSLWILCLNVLIFYLIVIIGVQKLRPFSMKPVCMAALILIIYFLPKIYGGYILANCSGESSKKIKIAVVQPNIDPFEKWSGKSVDPLDIVLKQTASVAHKQVDLILWPETAIPFYILDPSNRNYFEKIKMQIDSLNTNLLTGIPDIYYYKEGDNIPKSSKVTVSGERYDTFNSSMLLQPRVEGEIQKYAKIILVPFAERVPFSEALSFLNAMEWNFGLGGWGHGRDTTVFHFQSSAGDTVKFSNLICYESVIPGFVSKFVNKGAQFLTIVTNDSWWGNTSGAYQHKQYAVLRAIENRRWIIQCSNGGISCFVDPLGRITQESTMFTQTVMYGDITPSSEQSFYSRNGDWLAEFTFVISGFFLVAAYGKKYYNYIRKGQMNGIH